MGSHPRRARLKAARMAAADIVARPARAPDFGRVFALQEQAFPGDRLALDRPGFEACIQDRQAFLVVVERGGEIAGYGLARNRPWRPWTSGDFLSVDPVYGGQGIGGIILNAAMKWAGRPFFRLFVRPSNARAIALYFRMGFVNVGRRRANYPDGEDALIMMKVLFTNGTTEDDNSESK